MFPSQDKAPAFSLVPLLGIVAKPVPPVVMQPLVDAIFFLLRRRHPNLFERLSELDTITFAIDPVDLPFVLILTASPSRPTLRIVRNTDATAATATVRGPLLCLIDLLEGRIDGDALFFSRALAIEGDTEAVVALRNAIDDAEIDLARDVLAPLGPLSAPLRRLGGVGGRVLRRAEADLGFVRASFLTHRQGNLDK